NRFCVSSVSWPDPREAPWYADAQLEREARFIDQLACNGIDSYVCFNNDAGSCSDERRPPWRAAGPTALRRLVGACRATLLLYFTSTTRYGALLRRESITA